MDECAGSRKLFFFICGKKCLPSLSKSSYIIKIRVGRNLEFYSEYIYYFGELGWYVFSQQK